MIYHATAYYRVAGGDLDLKPFTEIGFAGVDIFFVISGFIMWTTTSDKAGIGDASAFAYRRVVRIFTTWVIVFIPLLIYFAVGLPDKLADRNVLDTLFLTYNTQRVNMYRVTWTLQFELYFYALMALSLLVWDRRMIPAMIGALVLFNFLGGGSLIGRHYANFWCSPLLLEFLGGCAIGALKDKLPSMGARGGILLGFGLLATIALTLSFTPDFNLGGGDEHWLRIIVLGPVALLLVWAFAADNKRRYHPLLVRLGDASYGIYLWHMLVFGIMQTFLLHRGNTPPVLVELLWGGAVAFVCWWSLWSYDNLEKPALQRLRQPSASLERLREVVGV